MKLKHTLLALAVSFSAPFLKAQDYDLGLFVGGSQYQGDLSPAFDNGFANAFRGIRPAIGGLARYNFNPYFSIRGNVNLGLIAAYDQYGNKGTGREPRNLSFHTHILEVSGVAEVNFMKYIAGSRKYKFAPYGFVGVGVFHFSPKTFYNGDKYKLIDIPTEPNKDYSPIQIAIPVGLGIKYNIKDNWTLGFEFGWRKTFTDYLDDVSTKYPASAYTVTPGSSINDKLANRSGRTVTGANVRGNPDKKDSYYFFGITLSKTIRKYSCNNF